MTSLLSEASELLPQSPDDIRFTEDISERMTVPHHLSVHGEVPIDDPRPPNRDYEDGAISKKMFVPDRILVAGGDNHSGEKGTPREIQYDQQTMPAPRDPPIILSTPPSTLTLSQSPYPNDEDTVQQPSVDYVPQSPRHDDYYPSSTIRAALNPGEELILLKRQITRISTRLYLLETDNEARQKREYFVLMLTAGYFAVKLLKYMLTRR